MPVRRLAAALLVAAVVWPGGAVAAPNDPPYQAKLERLAEVLGSVHFLGNLCASDGSRWRDLTESLLATENPEPERRARIVAAFNRGYRAFASVHRTCTDPARAALAFYLEEGETLSADILSRFGN